MSLQKIEKLKPFKHFCMSIGELPSSYMESMTYLELLMWLCKYLSETVIPAINNNAQAVEELQRLFIQLQNFVDNYFDNLDVQEEINNKLDEMVEDGTLENILLNYSNVTRVYNTTLEMLEDKNHLVKNEKITTLGFYNIGDNGQSNYIITDIQNAEIYQIDLENGLFANLLPSNNSINIMQFGCIEDGRTDSTQYIAEAVACAKKLNIKNIVFNSSHYIISDYITIENISFIGNNTTFDIPIEEGEPYLWFSGSNYEISGIEWNLITSSSYRYVFRIENSENVLLKNCTLNWGADFRTNNKNMTIINCNFYESVTIRELYDATTENIKFINCHIERVRVDVDEVIWCVCSHGILRNIIFENCFIAHNGGSANCVAVSAYYNESICENIQFNNCIMNFKSQSYTFHIGGSSAIDRGITQNIKFNNCTITHTNYTSTSRFMHNESENDIYFNNCNFNISNCVYGFFKSVLNNCNIEILSERCFINCTVKNSIVKSNANNGNVFCGKAIVHNSEIYSKYKIGFTQASQFAQTYQEYINCKLINENYYMFTNSSSIGTLKLINCNINNNGNIIFVGSGSEEEIKWSIDIINCNFLDDNFFTILAGSNQYMKARFINNTHNNNIITGIPSTANARQLMSLNTIIPANAEDGLCYKKNIDDNHSTSWILYPFA